MSLRDEFPVLERIAYMNAGTDGPVPRRAAEAAEASLRAQLEDGRAGQPYFERLMGLRAGLREHAARLMGCAPGDVALTHSTTDGMNLVLRGFGLGRGDEVVTTDEEHPGLLAPLAALAARDGVKLTFAPFAEVANAVSATTRLIACSHVSWINGQVVDADALRATGVPTLLDGAQGLGAVPAHPAELGCAFYAAAGQKWLCGPDGSGFLYVAPDQVDALGAPWPGYQSLSDPLRAEELLLAGGAVRFDMGFPVPHDTAWALAAFEVLSKPGWQNVHDQATSLAASLAIQLEERGRELAPRGRSTLVAWKEDDPEDFVQRASEAGVAIRHLAGRGLVRASIGAWNDGEDVQRLLALTPGGQ